VTIFFKHRQVQGLSLPLSRWLWRFSSCCAPSLIGVEGGSPGLRIELTADDEGWTLRADGIGDIGSEPEDLPYRRVDLLMGLFPSMSIEGGSATIRSTTSV